MTEETLRELIAGGETSTVEFKSSAARPIDIAVRMCGIANNRAGGIIIFGIEDATRAIVGVHLLLLLRLQSILAHLVRRLFVVENERRLVSIRVYPIVLIANLCRIVRPQ